MKKLLQKNTLMTFLTGLAVGAFSAWGYSKFIHRGENELRPVPAAFYDIYKKDIPKYKAENDPRKKIEIADALVERFSQSLIKHPPFPFNPLLRREFKRPLVRHVVPDRPDQRNRSEHKKKRE